LAGTLQIRNDHGPLKVSGDNARYFTDNSGKAIWLTGSKYWLAIQDGGRTDPPAAFDWDTYLTTMSGKGHNLIPFYAWEHCNHTSDEQSWYIAPLPFVNNGSGSSPNFDLTSYDPVFFDRLRRRIIEARQLGMYVSINLFHGFSTRSGTFNTITNAWGGNPFKSGNNSNSIDGDPTASGDGYDVHTLNVSAITTIQDSLVEHYIDVLGDLDNIVWEVACETDGTYTRSDNDCDGWQDHIIDKIHTYEATKDKQHPVLYSVQWPGGDNSEIKSSAAEAYAPNANETGDGTSILMIDTDHIDWTSTDAKWPWQALCRGAGAFMIMDGGYSDADDQGGGATYAGAEPLRNNMGYALELVSLIDVLQTQPQDAGTSPCDTGYCLYPASSNSHDYLIFQGGNSDASLDLSSESGTFNIRKVNVADGAVDTEQTTTGGDVRTITQPSGWTSGWAALLTLS